MNTNNFQGNAVINYTDIETPFTRIIEHKHFEFGQQEKTVISIEYPQLWKEETEPYYPVNTDQNNQILDKYMQKANFEKNVFFGGRLGSYKYYNMDQIVSESLKLYAKVNNKI